MKLIIEKEEAIKAFKEVNKQFKDCDIDIQFHTQLNNFVIPKVDTESSDVVSDVDKFYGKNININEIINRAK